MHDSMGRFSRRVALAAAIAGMSVSLFSGVAAARDGKEVKVAVAANFTEPAKEIAAAFEKSTGNKVVLSFGATGQLYAQITQGAPFEIFIAADKATPAKAVKEGHAVEGTAFTYAVGKLVLYSKSLDVTVGETVLKDGMFAKIAIANPATAPYGAAAVATMKALGVEEALKPKIVQGNNIAQTFQFVDTGNAEIGFVALSQVKFAKTGSQWVVPSKLYSQIAQDAVLLKTGATNDAAKAFVTYLQGPEARAVIEKFGYGIGE